MCVLTKQLQNLKTTEKPRNRAKPKVNMTENNLQRVGNVNLNLLPVVITGEKETKNKIDSLRTDRSLSFFEKKRLIKAEVVNYTKMLQAQGETALQAETSRQKAVQEIEGKFIVAQKIHVVEQLKAKFGDMMASLGQQVALDNIQHTIDFSKKLTKIREELAESKIEGKFLSVINAQIDKALDEYMAKLSEVFSDALSK